MHAVFAVIYSHSLYTTFSCPSICKYVQTFSSFLLLPYLLALFSSALDFDYFPWLSPLWAVRYGVLQCIYVRVDDAFKFFSVFWHLLFLFLFLFDFWFEAIWELWVRVGILFYFASFHLLFLNFLFSIATGSANEILIGSTFKWDFFNWYKIQKLNKSKRNAIIWSLLITFHITKRFIMILHIFPFTLVLLRCLLLAFFEWHVYKMCVSRVYKVLCVCVCV